MRLLSVLIALTGLASGRTIESFDADWRFQRGDVEGGEKVEFKDQDWRQLDVPHDWSIEGDFAKDAPSGGAGGWLPTGVGWYRKAFEVPAESEGKRVWLEFDGVMSDSEVWLNGERLGSRPNGYISFRFDLTDHLNFGGENVVAVRVDNSIQPASRWYAGAGIYRHVRLVTVDPVHVAPWGVFVSTPSVMPKQAKVKVATLVEGDAEVTVKSVILGPDGEQVATGEAKEGKAAEGGTEYISEIQVSEPKLWSLETPVLYEARTQVLVDGKLRDEVRTKFGIRKAEFRADSGFWLNGKNFKLKGVCLHHDAGALGSAVPLSAWARRFELLQELGVNAIRTSHNPVDPGFLDLCDTMGMLVMNEAFDCWTKGKNKGDYHRHFKEWAHKDLRDMVLRDRNHPSVVLYSVGNEIRDTHDADLAKEILSGLVEVCHQYDPTRPVTQALFRPNVTHDYDNGLSDLLDVVGTNYRDAELLQAWRDDKSRKIIGTEQGHERSTWFECRDNPQHAGQFLWVGIDYLGESRSWPLTCFNAGLLDRTGWIQPRGWERKSWWSDKPMVKMFRRLGRTEATPSDPGYGDLDWKRLQVLFPDWNGKDQENVEVYAIAGEVELFLNGKSLGTKQVQKDRALNWEIPFEAGTLKAVARIDGKEVAVDEMKTAGKPVKLELEAERPSIGTDFEDVVYVQVRVLDDQGVLVPNAESLVKFSVEGPGKIVGVDSGDIMSTERMQASQRKTFQGRCIAILRGTGPGEITLKAEADGLEPAQAKVSVK